VPLSTRRHALICLALALTALIPSVADTPAAAQTARLTFTKAAALANDLDGDGEAELGDTLRYTIVLANRAAQDIAGVTLDDSLDPQTTLVPQSLSTTPLAYDQRVDIDAQPIQIALAGRDVDGDPLSYSIVTPPSSGALGELTGATVVYSPSAVLLASDRFTFEVRDPDGNRDTATVHIVAPATGGAREPAPQTAPANNTLLPSRLTLDIGLLPAGAEMTASFEVAILGASRLGAIRLVNQARLDSETFGGLLSDDPGLPGGADPTVTVLTRRLYLPAVQTFDPRLPDLVVAGIEVTGSTVRVVVRNRGNATVVDPFRVDAYIGPRRAPSAFGETWPDLGDHGLVWFVAGPALPLEPGATIVLNIGDARYDASLSQFGGTVPSGTAVYAQVDSARFGARHGGVLEGHEAFGLDYNNIAGPVVAP
jgi:uncharacterized repeat protein (TIGR01451 family)